MNQSTEVRLTVAVIVRNSAEPLAETLDSVRSIASQVIVVDTGSTDETLAVAVHAGAQIINHPWADDFSEARNAVWGAVLGDWILWLDAGETLSEHDARQLHEFLQQGAEPSAAYAMVIQVPPNGSAIAEEQIARIRLVPDVAGLRFEGRVRETLSASLEAGGIRVEGLPFRIRRSAREHSADVKTRRARRNIQLADMEIAARGPSARMLNCLGEAFQALNENVRSSQQFRLALELAEGESAEMLEAYYGLLTSLDNESPNREAQLTICLEALEVYPFDAQLLCAMGNYLHLTNRLELAGRSFEVAYRHGQIHPEVWHLSEIREIAANCWSLSLLLQDKEAEAIQALDEALREFPQSWRLHRQLIEIHVKAGRRPEALAQFERTPRSMARRETLKSAVRGAALAGTGNWISARAYLQTAFQSGCQDTICFKWYILALLATGEPDRAREVLQQWKTVDPKNSEIPEYSTMIATASVPERLAVGA